MTHQLTQSELKQLKSCKQVHRTLATLFACSSCAVLLKEVK